jgi:glycosyltransferase involved in cell wall biosynthesis
MAPSKHLILVCGFARAGKDTFGRGLIAGATNAIDQTAFADTLKEALRVAANDVGIDVNYGREEDKLQDRPLLVEFGRAMRRRNKDVFARAIAQELSHMCDNHTYVVTDWRYLNEYAVMKEAADRLAINLHTVRIVRHGWQAANDEEAMSLLEIMEAVPFDETIYATSGDEEAVLLHGYRIAKLWKL